MHDTGKILLGVIIFLVLVTVPVWYNAASDRADVVPDPKIITTADQCVMPTDYMREAHMDLLDDWRDKVVREGIRVHTSHDGKKYNMSLTNTCMDCHSNKADFCDECHDYSAVGQPYCWDCHLETKEGIQ